MHAGAVERLERRRMSLEEFDALPDDVRAEYSRGVAIVSPPARHSHQALGGRLVRLLGSALPGCEVFQEGGLHTGGDGRRIPDVLVMPQIDDRVWSEQIPLLIVEILSPSTRSEDTLRKPQEYARIGVPYFWVVDREAAMITMLAHNGEGWDITAELTADHGATDVALGDHGAVRVDVAALLDGLPG